MNKLLIAIFLILFFSGTSLLAQDTISGQGYVISGLQRQDNGEWVNFYRLIYPRQQDELVFCDSIYKHALALKNYRFLSGKRKVDILYQIDRQNSYNLLAGRGLSKNDSFITQNSLSYDISGCASMRISRPFSANVDWAEFDSSGYILHIDKVEFDGYIVDITSHDLYIKLMSYRMEDRDNKLLSFIDNRKVVTKLSIKESENKSVSVFVPRNLKIFDRNYHNIEPGCFHDKDY